MVSPLGTRHRVYGWYLAELSSQSCSWLPTAFLTAIELKRKERSWCAQRCDATLSLIRREHHPRLDDLASLSANLVERAGVRCGDLVFHLHGLDDEQYLAGLDRLARCRAHRHDRAL